MTSSAHGSVQYSQSLELVNEGPTACTLSGFPGFELVGPQSNGSTAYDPIRQSVGYSTVLVTPGGTAHSVLTALTGPDTCDNGTAWFPATVTVTLPGGTNPIDIPWAGGSVDNCQGGATHPGTYIGPFVAGT